MSNMNNVSYIQTDRHTYEHAAKLIIFVQILIITIPSQRNVIIIIRTTIYNTIMSFCAHHQINQLPGGTYQQTENVRSTGKQAVRSNAE